eukprot:TRINITY_DN49047_c0_g1_i1.p1 TRINITY_DN49047_c0_g1~~TRINITY_DN49047_c0_g1_i1.p1  ORF type:complete len:1451 (+),score=331.11 TRINITY_DN49047_c0_g1_i1:487-4353(+)
MATLRKESHEKNDVVTGRIAALEASLETRIPSALADMKSANQKMQVSVNEQLDALKELQDTHRLAANDAVLLEKRKRDEAIQELNDKFQRSLQEEKNTREIKDKTLEESLEARIEAEKGERVASVRGLTELLNQERGKREQGIKTVEELIEGAIADERASRDTAHGEIHAALSREKTAKESHRAAMQRLIEEERAEREAVTKDLLAQHAAAKDDHQQHIEKIVQNERGLRDSALAELKRAMDGHHDHFSGLIDKEGANRAHLDDKISQERAHREKTLQEMFDKCRAEGDAVLQGRLDQEVATRTAAMEALQDMIEAETMNREKDVDEVREMIGAERKIRQDHHADFDAQFKKHRDEFAEHRDLLHARVDEEQANRQAHHDAHKEHLKGLLEEEGNARSEHHKTLSEQINDLRDMITGESEKRSTSTAAVQESIQALEEAFREGDPESSEIRTISQTESWSNRGGLPVSKTAQSESKPVLVPLRKQLSSLEAKILQEIGFESQAREAHRSDIQDMMESEAKTREGYFGSLKEQLEQLGRNHGSLQEMIDKERDARGAHLDAHSKERDALHGALQDRLDALHGKHNDQSAAHKALQEKINQELSSEVAKLRQFIAAENSALETSTKALGNRIDSLQDETSRGLSKEKALREATSKDLSEALSRRLEYVEAALESTDDARSEIASVVRTPVSLSFASDSTRNIGKRVVTVQQRLEVLERRLRDEIGREGALREADSCNFSELLKEETKLREDAQAFVKSQLEKERGARSACLKEESELLARDIEALRTANAKAFHEIEHRAKTLEEKVDNEVSVVKTDLDEERVQRIAADKAAERLHVALAEQVTSAEANIETHRQRFDLALGGQKKDVKERHDLVLERIAALENNVGEALPAAIAEMREADTKMQHSVKDQMEAVKAFQETHRSAITDLVSSEKSAREQAMHDLQGHVANRFAEERGHREAREAYIQDHINSRVGEEKEERDAALRSLGQTLSAERSKRDVQIAALRDEAMGSVADHRQDTDAKLAEAKAQINREREAREAHCAAAKALHEDTKKAHDTAIRDVKAHVEGARNELRMAHEKDSATMTAQAKENHSMLHERCTSLKNLVDEEARKRDGHLSKLSQLLNEEKLSREALLAKHRGEHEASLKDALGTLRQEHASVLKGVESTTASHGAMKDILTEATRRLEYIETIVGEGYLSDKQMKNLVTIRQQLDTLESKLRDDIVREAKARESEAIDLRQVVGEEVQAREGFEGCVKESFIKERSDREKNISEALARFKASLIRHFDGM